MVPSGKELPNEERGQKTRALTGISPVTDTSGPDSSAVRLLTVLFRVSFGDKETKNVELKTQRWKTVDLFLLRVLLSPTCMVR